MVTDYEITGVIKSGDLVSSVPSKERFKKGPVAIIECPQEIPCDACVAACPGKFIFMEKIVTPPEIEMDKCTGCGLCAVKCPGLAIFIVDMRNSPEGKAWVSIPYEFLLVPEIGDVVKTLDREGKCLGPAKVVKVVQLGKEWKTTIVTIEVDENLAMEARYLR